MIPNSYIAIIIPVFAAIIFFEIFVYYRRKMRFPWAEGFVSVAMALSYFAFNVILNPTLSRFNQVFYELRLIDPPGNPWLRYALLFLAVELAFYWQHRFAHQIRWIWASHCMHHSSSTLTLSGAYRLGITSVFSGVFLFYLPIFLLGFSLTEVAIMFGINLLYQFVLHTDLIPKLGWIELLFNTPSHHRVHHAINDAYINKNYGGILIVFDRIFGTFAEEQPSEPAVYGIQGRERSLNPITLTFQEWVAMGKDVMLARNVREVFTFAFGRPGWLPERLQPKADTALVKNRNSPDSQRQASNF